MEMWFKCVFLPRRPLCPNVNQWMQKGTCENKYHLALLPRQIRVSLQPSQVLHVIFGIYFLSSGALPRVLLCLNSKLRYAKITWASGPWSSTRPNSSSDTDWQFLKDFGASWNPKYLYPISFLRTARWNRFTVYKPGNGTDALLWRFWKKKRSREEMIYKVAKRLYLCSHCFPTLKLGMFSF